jgi:hypothetical protein
MQPQVTKPDGQRLRELLSRMPFKERWKPVAQEMNWVITGRRNPTDHKKSLPDYCYAIFDVYRRTIFKNLPTQEQAMLVLDQKRLAKCKSVREIKKCLRIDWRFLGRVEGIGMRGLRFFEFEAREKLKSDGLLDLQPEQERRVLGLMFGNDWWWKKLTILFLRPGRFVRTLAMSIWAVFYKIKVMRFSQLGDLAYQWSPEAPAEFSAGIDEGQRGFMDKDGQLVGESPRANIYEFLLLVWPEIKEMQKSNPPITRNDFNEWVKPFAKDGTVSINDLDQLLDVCDDIHLKFAGRGRPRNKAA